MLSRLAIHLVYDRCLGKITACGNERVNSSLGELINVL